MYQKQMMFVSIANSSSENSHDDDDIKVSHYNPISIVGDSSLAGGETTVMLVAVLLRPTFTIMKAASVRSIPIKRALISTLRNRILLRRVGE